MNTMQLSCFVEVAAQLSFSKAAEALHVSQPTVSHQIKALEDELGCVLLVRSTRTVRLTDDGFAFLEYANDILDLAARAERRLKHKQRPSPQQLRIGVQYIRATYPWKRPQLTLCCEPMIAQRAQQPYVTIRFPAKPHGARGVHSALTEHAAGPRIPLATEEAS